MELNETWEAQYHGDIETALKDKNLYELESKAILSHVSKYISVVDREELKVLELGCGTGELIKYIHESLGCENINIEYTGVDFAGSAIKKARSKNIEGASFEEADFIKYLSEQPVESVDIIITQRAIMALMEESDQKELLSLLRRVLKKNGCGIFSECFSYDFSLFNDYRGKAKLPPISKVWHSRYLDESMLEMIFENVTYDYFCSTYMMITRLIYPTFEEPRHNQEIHSVAAALPNSGDTSFLKIAIVS